MWDNVEPQALGRAGVMAARIHYFCRPKIDVLANAMTRWAPNAAPWNEHRWSVHTTEALLEYIDFLASVIDLPVQQPITSAVTLRTIGEYLYMAAAAHTTAEIMNREPADRNVLADFVSTYWRDVPDERLDRACAMASIRNAAPSY